MGAGWLAGLLACWLSQSCAAAYMLVSPCSNAALQRTTMFEPSEPYFELGCVFGETDLLGLGSATVCGLMARLRHPSPC